MTRTVRKKGDQPNIDNLTMTGYEPGHVYEKAIILLKEEKNMQKILKFVGKNRKWLNLCRIILEIY